ncbi:N-acetylneuraminate 9-O-acetyltransferase [Nymphon striatum]|nr:N-acetylneuraminate 9-O-acetyltransferase [Nymphon striatum]
MITVSKANHMTFVVNPTLRIPGGPDVQVGSAVGPRESKCGPIESSGTKWVQAYHNGPIVSRWSKLVQQWVQVGPVDSLGATAESPGQTRHDWTTWIRLDPGDFSPGGPDVQVVQVGSAVSPGEFSSGSKRIQVVQVGSEVGPSVVQSCLVGPDGPSWYSSGSKLIQVVQSCLVGPGGPMGSAVDPRESRWVQAYPGGPIVSSWSRWSKLVHQWVQVYAGGPIVSSWCSSGSMRIQVDPRESKWSNRVQWVQAYPGDPDGPSWWGQAYPGGTIGSKVVQLWVQENPSGPIESSGTKWVQQRVQAYLGGPIVSSWSKLVQQWVQENPGGSMMAAKEKEEKSVELIHYVNTKNAKISALLLLFGFVIYHGILHIAYGIDSCKWLLSDGRFQGYHVWQPYGCMLHSYTETDTVRCMKYTAYWGDENHILFIGDSRDKYHEDVNYTDLDLKLDVRYIWSPMINSKMYDVYKHWQRQPPDKQPALIITGSGTWAIKEQNGTEEALISYSKNLTNLVPILNEVAEKTKVLWMLQDPVVYEKLSEDRKVITNEQIDLYNKAAMDALHYSKVLMWSSSRLVAQGFNDDWEDGLHAGKVALKYDVQMLLNMYCNDKMNHQDGTCCSSAGTCNYITNCDILYVCCMCLHCHCPDSLSKTMFMETLSFSPDTVQLSSENSWSELFINLGKLGFIMAYFFLCDRTNFFMKENKYYTHLNFFLPVAYVFALGLFFTEESKFTQILHRDQTDEWMGWMQLIILIYHMTGASQVLPIYMHLRVVVSAYLFMTGYKHFTFFFKKGDFGLIRLFQMLFRLNLFTLCLCLCMNRPYQSYYFVPLVSFWFLVVWVTMAILPQVTSAGCEANNLHYLYMIVKILCAFGVITILYMSEVFFERIFVTRPWKALFVTTDDSIKQWWFRWKLDRYGVLSGMVFGFICYILQKNRIIEDNNHNNLFSRSLGCLISMFGFVGLIIVGFVILRNISGLIRSRYSTFFAWFGKISLELFVGQYHIWLAADTHGVLVLVPSYPVLNVVITSFIFICLAHEISVVTGKLVKYAIPNDWKLLVRNFVIFFLILVPIGIHDGMF